MVGGASGWAVIGREAQPEALPTYSGPAEGPPNHLRS